ncbi:MAG: 2-hydroxycarboxylate transporter family protein, partial [Myxococcaceae bacterium]|nr:2-hydroxycarboxylate transporter family protein [Myxococcaceae bacterium]
MLAGNNAPRSGHGRPSVSVARTAFVCGLLGVVFGIGFWDNILYILVAMTSGGMTAGTVPLST